MVEAEGNPTTWKFTQYVPISVLAITSSPVDLVATVLACLPKTLWDRH